MRITAQNIGRNLEVTGSRAAVSTCVIWLLLLLIPTGPVEAQLDTFENLREYMDRTMEVLIQAQDVVRESESVRAHRVLEQAEKLREQSEERWAQGQLRQAFQASRNARQTAIQAARMARQDLSYEERARIKLDRLRELHDQVRERALEVNDQRVLRFIYEAERQYHRARELYAQRDFEMAYTLLESTQKMLRRAGRLLFEGGGAGRLESELERTRSFLITTREQLGPDADPAALDLLTRAENQFTQANEALTASQPFRALQLMRQARRLAGQALSMAGNGPSPESVQTQLDRWDSRAAEVADRVRDSGNEEAHLVLERAQHYRQRAEELLREGDRVGALRQIKTAHDLLSEASELTR